MFKCCIFQQNDSQTVQLSLSFTEATFLIMDSLLFLELSTASDGLF